MPNSFFITDEESLYIERLFYVYKSYENFCKVIAKELMEYTSEQKKEILHRYADECRQAFIELDYARDQIIIKYLGEIPNNISYKFNFEKNEVEYNL